MMAAAAMIGLVAVLGLVIYTIVKPVSGPQVDVAKMFSAAEQKATAAKMELTLATEQATAVNAFIYRNIILENGLQDSFQIEKAADKNIYSISCSRARAAMVLEELGTIWDKFNQSTLSVDGTFISNVTAGQAVQLAKEESKEEQVNLARAFDAENKIAAEQATETVVAAVDKDVNEIAITKPALASGAEKPGPNEPGHAEKISFVITIIGNN